MAKKKSESEIDALQQEVKKLGARGPTQKKNAEKPPEEPSKDEKTGKEKVAGSEQPELREKIEEFAGLLQEELNQIPAMTAIAIFALGFVFGRLMSK